MTLISPAHTREDLIVMILQRDELVSDLKEVCTTQADRIERLEAALEQSDALGKYWQARAIAAEESISGTTLAAIAKEQSE